MIILFGELEINIFELILEGLVSYLIGGLISFIFKSKNKLLSMIFKPTHYIYTNLFILFKKFIWAIRTSNVDFEKSKRLLETNRRPKIDPQIVKKLESIFEGEWRLTYQQQGMRPRSENFHVEGQVYQVSDTKYRYHLKGATMHNDLYFLIKDASDHGFGIKFEVFKKIGNNRFEGYDHEGTKLSYERIK